MNYVEWMEQNTLQKWNDIYFRFHSYPHYSMLWIILTFQTGMMFAVSKPSNCNCSNYYDSICRAFNTVEHRLVWSKTYHICSWEKWQNVTKLHFQFKTKLDTWFCGGCHCHKDDSRALMWLTLLRTSLNSFYGIYTNTNQVFIEITSLAHEL